MQSTGCVQGIYTTGNTGFAVCNRHSAKTKKHRDRLGTVTLLCQELKPTLGPKKVM